MRRCRIFADIIMNILYDGIRERVQLGILRNLDDSAMLGHTLALQQNLGLKGIKVDNY